MSALDKQFISLYDDVPYSDMKMPLCAGGTKVGMLECAIPSDPFAYILMKNPKTSSRRCKCTI